MQPPFLRNCREASGTPAGASFSLVYRNSRNKASHFENVHLCGKEYQDILDSGLIDSVVLGIPDELCQYLVVSGETGKSIYYNGEELYDGCHVLCISTADYGQSFDSTCFYTGDVLSSESLEMNYEVIGARLPYGLYRALGEICSCSYIGSEEALFLLPMSVFEKEFHDAPVFTVLANAKEDMGETLRKEVRSKRTFL